MTLFTSGIDATSVSTASVLTQLEIDQVASRFLTVKQWWLEFDGVTASNVPVQSQFVIVTAASSSVFVAATIVSGKNNQAAAAAFGKVTPNAEGTVSLVEPHRIPPTSGLLVQYPLGEEPAIVGAASSASGVALRCKAGAAVNSTAGCAWEE